MPWIPPPWIQERPLEVQERFRDLYEQSDYETQYRLRQRADAIQRRRDPGFIGSDHDA